MEDRGVSLLPLPHPPTQHSSDTLHATRLDIPCGTEDASDREAENRYTARPTVQGGVASDWEPSHAAHQRMNLGANAMTLDKAHIAAYLAHRLGRAVQF